MQDQRLKYSELTHSIIGCILPPLKVMVELKTVKALAPEHEAQIINYLHGTGIEVGLLINFGNPQLDFKRFSRIKHS